MYDFDEDTGIATLYIITNAPERFVDSTGALFYTADGTATGSGGIVGHVIKITVAVWIAHAKDVQICRLWVVIEHALFNVL